tara:strand:+ start:1626 stop:1844 length:219 start_codon:yes stop_codon:yes gene_type:complete
MWFSIIQAANSLPKILSALERLGDIATARMAMERMKQKNEDIETIIAAATARREQRMLEREAPGVQRDSGEE